jgi:hypothetical protein
MEKPIEEPWCFMSDKLAKKFAGAKAAVTIKCNRVDLK